MGLCASQSAVDERATESTWSKLDTVAPATVPLYSFNGLDLPARVVNVLDGDTIEVLIVRESVEKHRLRLAGIDAPEIYHGKKEVVLTKEQQAGAHSKAKLLERLNASNNHVIVRFDDDDKYGRRMGRIMLPSGECVNDWMIASRYARQYKGEKKCPFAEWENQYNWN